ncbi:Uncharacterised protein [Chlamydia trachomatis]|nr:Uncharacterised protein [Chlamydia trachomatis]
MPASTSLVIPSNDSVAGPIVSTILAFLIMPACFLCLFLNGKIPTFRVIVYQQIVTYRQNSRLFIYRVYLLGTLIT